jgi:fructosamine-3-kinase
MPDWQTLFSALGDHQSELSPANLPRPVGGGNISAAWQLRTADGMLFLKTGPAYAYSMFRAEADGLRELAQADAVRVPKVLHCVRAGNESLLALEWIDFGIPDSSTEQALGTLLAKQHRVCKERFGWHRDNTIGSTPQKNAWSADWISFFAEHRLGFQLELAERKGFRRELRSEGRQLIDNLGDFFSGYRPMASLLHGDLWGGNWAAAEGQPVIFDPAVYYGDRETDIAMTRLFGGFGHGFYAAYEAAWPLAAGSEKRIRLYQLYHVLNHLNLFGGSYLRRAQNLLRDLCN